MAWVIGRRKEKKKEWKCQGNEGKNEKEQNAEIKSKQDLFCRLINWELWLMFSWKKRCRKRKEEEERIMNEKEVKMKKKKKTREEGKRAINISLLYKRKKFLNGKIIKKE